MRDSQRRFTLVFASFLLILYLQPLFSLPKDFIISKVNPLVTSLYYRLGEEKWHQIDATAPSFSLPEHSYDQLLSLAQYVDNQQLGQLLYYRYDERLGQWVYDESATHKQRVDLFEPSASDNTWAQTQVTPTTYPAENPASRPQWSTGSPSREEELVQEPTDTAGSIIQTIPYGQTYRDLPTPIKEGQIFVGWYTEIDGGERLEEETPLVVHVDHMLYAHWVAQSFEVTLNPMGGYFDESKIGRRRSKKVSHLALSIAGSYHHTTEGFAHLYDYRYGGDIGLSFALPAHRNVILGVGLGVQYARSNNIWADAYLIGGAGVSIGYRFTANQQISLVPSIGYDLLIHYGLDCLLDDVWYLSHQVRASLSLEAALMPPLALFVEPAALFMMDNTTKGFLFGISGGVKITI